jgi:hypothetical protein
VCAFEHAVRSRNECRVSADRLSAAAMGFLSQVVNGLGTRYRAVVGARLKQYGA